MADKDPVVEFDTATSLIEQLGKAFLQMKALEDAAKDSVQWMDLEGYFHHLQTMMKKKVDELEVKEREFKERVSEAQKLIAEKEAVIAAREQDFLDRIQIIKDAAVAAIIETRVTHQPESLEGIDGGDGKESKVSSFLGDTASEENSPNKTGENAEDGAGEVKPRPELTQFCELMDTQGLLNYTMGNQNVLPTLRAELSMALETTSEPGRLVLAALEGFFPPDDITQEGDEGDAALQGMRQSCLMFMEAMATLLARADPGADHLLNPEIKQQAKDIADEWKPKLAGTGIDAANGNALEAEAFLQLLATFRIASEFDEEELCKLVLAVAHQRRAPELCRSLGLTHQMPGVIEVLVNSGKQIDAAHFIHSFQLDEQFPLVPLLKAYLKDLRRNSQGKRSNSGSGGPQNDVNAQELAALRAVIRCVKEYKLEADYPLDPLWRRVGQLDKSKSDRKRFGESGKHQQTKKQRPNGAFYGSRAPGSAITSPAAAGGRPGLPIYGERAAYTGMPERYTHSGQTIYDYQGPSQPVYAQQVHDQRSYYYAQDDRITQPAYNAVPPSYGSYTGGGLPSSHQPYM